MQYPSDGVVYTVCGATVPLKFIESITFQRDSEGNLIDKLKDDVCFSIRIISGKEYEISTKLMSKKLPHYKSLLGLAEAIHDKWMRLHHS